MTTASARPSRGGAAPGRGLPTRLVCEEFGEVGEGVRRADALGLRVTFGDLNDSDIDCRVCGRRHPPGYRVAVEVVTAADLHKPSRVNGIEGNRQSRARGT